MERFDAIVVGGGPAGSAVALTLATAGHSVAVLEQSSNPGHRAGDVLPPEVRPLLEELGVWERFRFDGHLRSPGMVSVWGSGAPVEKDFIHSPWGDGWHVDRPRFDRGLLDAAERAGATVRRRTYVRGAAATVDGWLVAAVTGEHRQRLVSEFLVVATGRASSPGRMPGTRKIAFDRLVGVVATVKGNGGPAEADGRLLLEASEHGWWYSAGFSGRRLVVAWMTDPDVTARDGGRLRERWRRHLGDTVQTRARVANAVAADPRPTAASTSYRRAARGRWIAVGDAAAAYDPLSGQGVMRALTTGRAAGAAILARQAGEAAALDVYADSVAEDFRRYLHLRKEFYGAERRWPASVFWERRHGDPRA